MRIQEIETLDKSDFNPGAGNFIIWSGDIEKYKSRMRPLPGSSNYTYVIEKEADNIIITILDPEVFNQDIKKPYFIGEITVYSSEHRPAGTLQVRGIKVHPKYRGRGIAKALYGLVLLPKPTGLGKTLLSDYAQTPGGIQNWSSLSKIPGVEVTGLIQLPKQNSRDLARMPNLEKSYEEILTDLLSKVGGFYYGESYFNYFYEIPVTRVGKKLENAVKNSMLKIYPSNKQFTQYVSYLMAKYVGAQR